MSIEYSSQFWKLYRLMMDKVQVGVRQVRLIIDRHRSTIVRPRQFNSDASSIDTRTDSMDWSTSPTVASVRSKVSSTTLTSTVVDRSLVMACTYKFDWVRWLINTCRCRTSTKHDWIDAIRFQSTRTSLMDKHNTKATSSDRSYYSADWCMYNPNLDRNDQTWSWSDQPQTWSRWSDMFMVSTCTVGPVDAINCRESRSWSTRLVDACTTPTLIAMIRHVHGQTNTKLDRDDQTCSWSALAMLDQSMQSTVASPDHDQLDWSMQVQPQPWSRWSDVFMVRPTPNLIAMITHDHGQHLQCWTSRCNQL